MCMFRANMKYKYEKEWKVGWKKRGIRWGPIPFYTSGPTWYSVPITSDAPVRAHQRPTISNETGFYIYTKRREGTVKVLYRGYCVYGYSSMEGVRAEWIRFPGFKRWKSLE
jgi:hypothetical protein